MKLATVIILMIFISGCAVSGTPETLAWAKAATNDHNENLLFSCWSESYKKLETCDGLSCMWGVLTFAEQCGKNAGPSQKACSMVPSSPFSYVQWVKGTCVDVGHPTEACMKTLGKVAQVCNSA